MPDEDNRIHRCLSKRIYRQFPQDSRRPRERPASLCDDWDTSGGEDDGGMSDEDMSELEVTFNLVSMLGAWLELVNIILMSLCFSLNYEYRHLLHHHKLQGEVMRMHLLLIGLA